MTTNAFVLLLSAWISCESGGNPYAVNGKSGGILQLQTNFIVQVNRQCGTTYPLWARWDADASRAIVWTWWSKRQKKTAEQLTLEYYSGNRGARHPGPRATNHWRKVQRELEER